MSAQYPDDLVLHLDETGELDLVSFVVGPAGRADIEIADGVTVAVDFAAKEREGQRVSRPSTETRRDNPPLQGPQQVKPLKCLLAET